jgi:hypothetical protein
MDNSVNILENPVNILKNPVNILKNPVNILKNPVNILKNPVNGPGQIIYKYCQNSPETLRSLGKLNKSWHNFIAPKYWDHLIDYLKNFGKRYRSEFGKLVPLSESLYSSSFRYSVFAKLRCDMEEIDPFSCLQCYDLWDIEFKRLKYWKNCQCFMNGFPCQTCLKNKMKNYICFPSFNYKTKSCLVFGCQRNEDSYYDWLDHLMATCKSDFFERPNLYERNTIAISSNHSFDWDFFTSPHIKNDSPFEFNKNI